jgi:indolepyruvate ferredoxin oxidoreductase alpha subunit
MKHVGLNVAADPFMTLSYLGCDGGLVVITADDPSMHSSQNEQDNRHFGPFAKVPVLEPSNSQECKDFVGIGLEMSEEFDTPVIIRLTTRTSHAKSVVYLGERSGDREPEYEKDIKKRLCLPAHARLMHARVEERMKKLAEWAETTHINELEMGETDIGIVTDGVAYNYVKEVFPDKSVLKLGMVWPLPMNKIRDFAEKVDRLLVIEELDPIIETEVKAAGIACEGKEVIPALYELNPGRVREAVLGEVLTDSTPEPGLPPRPPQLCPGCGHRTVYYALARLKATVFGDIGCYTLGALPPLNAMDTCVCMGASITDAAGFIVAMGDKVPKRVCATIGESTFIHSGMTGLVNVVHNQVPLTTVILDNSITAMTGHQHNAASGYTIKGEPAPELDFEQLCRALGVKKIWKVDTWDLRQTRDALKEAMACDEPTVVIVEGPCVLLERKKYDKITVVDEETCNGCRVCIGIGCPAITMDGELAKIDNVLCTRCDLCIEVCPTDAIAYQEVK